jgi:hypothetical protein
MLGSESMGAPPYQGEHKGQHPHHFRARSGLYLHFLATLPRTGLRITTQPLEASRKPLEGNLAPLVGIHRGFIARCYRRGCPAATPDRLHNSLALMAAGFAKRS